MKCVHGLEWYRFELSIQGRSDLKMKNKFARVRLFLLLLSLVVTVATAATPVCQSHYPSPAATEAMLTMADRTAQQLDALPGTQVAIIARSGQNLSRYVLRDFI